ncbi:hypothetical protein Ancab_022379 [Ancistrocladus abbreviatus]
MDAYALHLTVAALVGASFVAFSAYYTHRKTLSQLLEFAKALERERQKEDAEEEALPQPVKRSNAADKRRSRVRRKSMSNDRSFSDSKPDGKTISAENNGEGKRNDPVAANRNPAGLPRIHTLPEGMLLVDFSPEYEF